MHTTIKALAIAMTAALIPIAAQAAPILDQQYDPADANLGGGLEQRPGQSFTVGRDGLLDRVELDLDRSAFAGPSTLTLEIRKITGELIGDVLRSTTLSSTEVPLDGFDFVSFDFLDLEVDIGDVFLIVLSATQDNRNDVFWHFDSGAGSESAGTYADGSAFNDEIPQLTADRAFRTFVDDEIAAVPEPGMLALFGTALFGIALRRRKTRA